MMEKPLDIKVQNHLQAVWQTMNDFQDVIDSKHNGIPSKEEIYDYLSKLSVMVPSNTK
jgi:hypothetical protein